MASHPLRALATPLLSLLAFCLLAPLAARATEHAFAAYLAAGEFGPATELAQRASTPAERDAALEKIAAAQASAGALRASLSTAAEIEGDLTRTAALRYFSEARLGAAGGAAEADFDSLIDLITSTIAPETWDDVGGPGAIDGFEGGVYVNAAGLMEPVDLSAGSARLDDFRALAARDSGNRQARRDSPLRMISLNRLERAVQLRRAAGLDPDEAMQVLAGLSKIQYVFVFPESGELVIAGPAGDWQTNHEGRLVRTAGGRPVLRLDDLIVVLRSAASDDPVFGCSITPYQENLAETQAFLNASAEQPLRPGQRDRWLAALRDHLGRQAIDVYGIDPHSRAARVLVEADYHMKLVGMGLEDVSADVPSYLDRLAERGGTPEMQVLRWWFTLNYDSLATTESRDAYEIRGCGVRVLSENEMLTERGERVHTGQSEGLNSEFARNFTQHFSELATQYPVYAELENIFDLALVAALARSEDLSGQVSWHQSYFGDEALCPIQRGAAPGEVESVIAHRVVDRTQIVAGVSGGVRVDPSEYVAADAIEVDEYGKLGSTRTAAQPPAELGRDQWWWDP